MGKPKEAAKWGGLLRRLRHSLKPEAPDASYIPGAMPPRKKPQKETSWNVLLMRGSGTVSLGVVHAVDEADALKKAVEKFAIRPELQSRIIVRQWD